MIKLEIDSVKTHCRTKRNNLIRFRKLFHLFHQVHRG